MKKQLHLIRSAIGWPRGELGYQEGFALRPEQRDEIRHRLRNFNRQNRLGLMDSLFDIYVG